MQASVALDVSVSRPIFPRLVRSRLGLGEMWERLGLGLGLSVSSHP